jgi:hypothetical protein
MARECWAMEGIGRYSSDRAWEQIYRRAIIGDDGIEGIGSRAVTIGFV